MADLLKNLAWVMLTSSATVTCQLLAKYGVARIAPLDFGGRPVATMLSIATSPFIVGGLFVQAFGFTVWLTVIARTNLTWAVGIASVFVYLLTAICNRLILGEGINTVQTIGIFVLCLGALLLSYTPAPL
jgi:drug/metabolite transporter (DMT)-like permease